MRQTTHTGTRTSKGPLAGAGPYEYDLPATRDGQLPAPPPAQAESGGGWKLSALLTSVLFAGPLLDELSALTLWQSYMVSYGVVGILCYWVGPKSQQSFLSWTLKIVGLWLNFYVALVTVPKLLRAHIPEPLAFGLPALVAFLIFFCWMPPMKPTDQPVPRWRLAMCAAIFATLWGWVGPTLGM